MEQDEQEEHVEHENQEYLSLPRAPCAPLDPLLEGSHLLLRQEGELPQESSHSTVGLPHEELVELKGRVRKGTEGRRVQYTVPDTVYNTWSFKQYLVLHSTRYLE